MQIESGEFRKEQDTVAYEKNVTKTSRQDGLG